MEGSEPDDTLAWLDAFEHEETDQEKAETAALRLELELAAKCGNHVLVSELLKVVSPVLPLEDRVSRLYILTEADEKGRYYASCKVYPILKANPHFSEKDVSRRVFASYFASRDGHAEVVRVLMKDYRIRNEPYYQEWYNHSLRDYECIE